MYVGEWWHSEGPGRVNEPDPSRHHFDDTERGVKEIMPDTSAVPEEPRWEDQPVTSVAIARPGDMILLFMRDSLSPAAADQMHSALSKHLPGVTFAIVERVTGAVVVRPEDRDGDA